MGSLVSSLTDLTVSPLSKGLAIALAVATVTAGVEGVLLKREIESKAACATSAKDAVTQAKQVNAVVKTRDADEVQQTQVSVSSTVAADVSRLRARPAASAPVPTSADPTSGIDSSTTPSIILPDDRKWVVTERDEEDCVIAIDVAEGWQHFYKNIQTIRIQENGESATGNNLGGTSSPQGVPSSPSISDAGSIRVGKRVGEGRDGPVQLLRG